MMTDSGPIEILLVEDNPADAELTVRAPRNRHLGNRVRHIEDGAEAIEFLLGDGSENHKPRLVLLDIKLPKVDGLEVLRRLRADDRTMYLPVVVMTSSREGQDLRTAYELGVNSYVVKPVDFDEFAKVVEQLGMYWLLVNEPPDE